MCHRFMHEYHLRPETIDDLFEGADYLDVMGRIKRCLTAIADSK